MTALWPKDSLTFTFHLLFSYSMLNWTTFVKEVFVSVFSLESDEMTALWPNGSLTFTFYLKFSNSIPNWATFVNPLCTGGGPKDPQLSKSLNALKLVHKNCWNVFDFSYIDLKKISIQKFWNFFWGGVPPFRPLKLRCLQKWAPQNRLWPHFFIAESFSTLKMGMFAKN